MNTSTKDVTLLVTFVNDIIEEVEKLEGVDLQGLRELYQDYDLRNNYAQVPIRLYNDMCTWVGKHLGEETLINIGRNIGETIYEALLENAIVTANPSPQEIISGLEIAAASMIQDPLERGWEILDEDDESIWLRRTQTFNGKLQFGLLCGLLSKCQEITNIEVRYDKEYEKGDAYDEYVLSWDRVN
ncbi:MAG: hypothetical protein AAFU64_04920 [Bacteroidota bacterium]